MSGPHARPPRTLVLIFMAELLLLEVEYKLCEMAPRGQRLCAAARSRPDFAHPAAANLGPDLHCLASLSLMVGLAAFGDRSGGYAQERRTSHKRPARILVMIFIVLLLSL
jgi:hypothetical protein